MKDLILFIGAWSLAAYVLTALAWTSYLSVMNLKRNQEHLTWITKAFGYPILIVGWALDILFNATVGTIMFKELPREWLMTDRLNRMYATERGEKLRRAVWFWHTFLDPFDPDGKHCGK